ncbi:hypothetical protein [Dysgonomonas sp. 520]|uniref:hypothetical protein n=1 Tax=Dysgonomonas sp. 520 TaxID=2302931 RepID=UPI0013D1CACF|nr:hypothetical protein [Dysgonomonas sp. 520]NDW10818.1 hypothetical protein [Dysgonomonas sp. 520]
MKKSSLILLIFLAVTALKAQVGVNTENPQGIFHIDGKRDTNGNTNVADDVVVTSDGNMGVGTVSPSNTLEINNGSFKYVNGNQKSGYVLQSDADGNADWVIQKARRTIVGDLTSLTPDLTSTSKYAGVSITLPAGIWQITFIGTYNAGKTTTPYNIIWDLSTSSTTNTGGGSSRSISYAANNSTGNIGRYSTVNAIYLVQHSTETTYYMWGNTTSGVTADYTGEARIWGMSID